MKKNIVKIMLALSVVGVLAGCGKTEETENSVVYGDDPGVAVAAEEEEQSEAEIEAQHVEHAKEVQEGFLPLVSELEDMMKQEGPTGEDHFKKQFEDFPNVGMVYTWNEVEAERDKLISEGGLGKVVFIAEGDDMHAQMSNGAKGYAAVYSVLNADNAEDALEIYKSFTVNDYLEMQHPELASKENLKIYNNFWAYVMSDVVYQCTNEEFIEYYYAVKAGEYVSYY